MNILNIPKCLHKIIFEYLDSDDIVNMKRTCKYIHNLFKKNSLYIKRTINKLDKIDTIFRIKKMILLNQDYNYFKYIEKHTQKFDKLINYNDPKIENNIAKKVRVNIDHGTDWRAMTGIRLPHDSSCIIKKIKFINDKNKAFDYKNMIKKIEIRCAGSPIHIIYGDTIGYIRKLFNIKNKNEIPILFPFIPIPEYHEIDVVIYKKHNIKWINFPKMIELDYYKCNNIINSKYGHLHYYKYLRLNKIYPEYTTNNKNIVNIKIAKWITHFIFKTKSIIKEINFDFSIGSVKEKLSFCDTEWEKIGDTYIVSLMDSFETTNLNRQGINLLGLTYDKYNFNIEFKFEGSIGKVKIYDLGLSMLEIGKGICGSYY